jgi:hypothetical protein
MAQNQESTTWLMERPFEAISKEVVQRTEIGRRQLEVSSRFRIQRGSKVSFDYRRGNCQERRQKLIPLRQQRKQETGVV